MKPKKDKGPKNSYNNNKETKVMVAAWGESESDEEPQEGTEECMMAHGNDIELLSSDKVCEADLIKVLRSRSKDELVSMIKKLNIEIGDIETELETKEKLVEDLLMKMRGGLTSSRKKEKNLMTNSLFFLKKTS